MTVGLVLLVLVSLVCVGSYFIFVKPSSPPGGDVSGLRWEGQENYRTELAMRLGLDPLPERTPLNPQTVGVVERDGYRIEKVRFESFPGFYVTANLYIPKNVTFPVPAIVNPHGHWGGGKDCYQVQYRAIGLVKKGYVCESYVKAFPLDGP